MQRHQAINGTGPGIPREQGHDDVSDHLKTYFFERRADRYRCGPIGKGSIHELCRPQTAHRHSDWGWAELGEVISGTP